MKDNNLNNTKNVECSDIYYKPEGQINRSVYELLKSSKEADYNFLKQIIDEKEFQGSTLNLALRNLIKDYKPEKENYILCLKLLLSTNIDLNYKYPKENNSTLLMMVFKKFELYLMKDFLENLDIKLNAINNNYLSDEEKEEYEMKEKKIFFSQKDSNNNNFMHLFDISFDKNELLNIFVYIYDKYPYYNNPKPEISQNLQQIFKNLFLERNNDGDTIMNICLIYGLPKFILKLISINGYVPNINKQKNNYIHCAILGKNLASLKILLYYCGIEELNMENSDNLTPSQLAFKLGYVTISNLIIEYQNHFNVEGYKEHFYSTMEEYEKKIKNLSNDLLINFLNHKFKEIFYELNELKIINNLVNDNSPSINNIEKEEEIIYKISYLKLEWNIILLQMKINENNYEKESESNNIKSNNKMNKNNKKKIKKVEVKNKNYIIPFFKSAYDLFENIFSNSFIISYIDLVNQLENKDNKDNKIKYSEYYINIKKSIDILIYNKILFYFRFGYINSVIDTAKIYLIKIFSTFNDSIYSNKKPFILFVNISCLLAEIFISQGYYNFAEFIFSALDKYLFTIFQENENIDYFDFNKEEITIFNYLNKTGVLNQFWPSFSEIFCYSNFLKLLITKDRVKELFSQIQTNLKESEHSDEYTILNRLYILRTCIEIKKLYEKEDNQIHNKISELHNYGEAGEIYYFNTLGIIYLKKQKYNLSKMFFSKAFNKYIQIIKSKNVEDNNKEKLLNYRIDYITSFLYNISLCHFYLKNYNKCIVILEQLLLFKNNQKNFFIHYRLALCYLYLYSNGSKKNSDYYNENISKIIGYEKTKYKNKKSKNKKPLSIDLENEDNNKFVSKNKKKDIYKNDNIDLYNEKDKNSNSFVDNYNENKSPIKRIILKNTTKYMKNNNIIFANKNNIENDKYKLFNKDINIPKNIITNYIDKATYHFKKVILLSKMNTYTLSMKSLYEFYSKYTEEKSEKNDENFYKKKKISNDLLINTYLNLLLCLSIKKNWLEMLMIIKNYNNKKINSNKIILLKFLLYKLEAYINLKNSQKIKEIINKLKGYKKAELSLFNRVNNDIINEVNIKLYLYYSLSIIYMKEKNYKEMDININKILLILKDEINIPYYIIDLLINVYLSKLNSESNINEKTKYRYNNIILNLIKNKKTKFDE